MRSGIPEAEWLLGEIEFQEGWFRFPPHLASVISRLKVENYPLLYSHENAAVFVPLKPHKNHGSNHSPITGKSHWFGH